MFMRDKIREQAGVIQGLLLEEKGHASGSHHNDDIKLRKWAVDKLRHFY
jgi:hypothetical protein